jgi:5-methyltetrahydrofolate--homocysteine methyltransferase
MDRKEFAKILTDRILVLDGAYGTEYFKKGFGNIPGEVLNLKHPQVVENLQREYVNAGSDILIANTFSANRLKLKSLGYEKDIEEINIKGVNIARKAGNSNTLVFGDISSTGEFPVPVGTIPFNETIEIFKEQASILLKAGVDGFIIETMSDIKELKAAVLAIRELEENIPLIAHMTFEKNLRAITGTSIGIFGALFNDLDVDCIGMNCSLGPKDSFEVFKELSKYTNKFLSIEPNAGKPVYDGENLTYKTTPQEFALYVEDYINYGANIIGGCCGTTPEHIKLIKQFAKNSKPAKKQAKIAQVFTSRTILKEISPFTIIGERINPANRKKFQDELIDGNFDTVIKEANLQKDEGSKILDLNLGIEKLLNFDHFVNVINKLDKNSSLPLSLDIQTPKYLNVAMKEYPGRPLINSARVTEKNLMRRIGFLKKYGGMLILLAMGKGIPETASERIKLILEGVKMCEENGISRDRIIADALILSFGAGKDPKITLDTIRGLSDEGIKTTFGLSNLSFGLPNRSLLNGTFLAQCIEGGLTSAIMNSNDQFVMESLDGALTLRGDKVDIDQSSVSDNKLVKLLLTGDVESLKKEINIFLETNTPLEISQNILGKSMEEIGILYGKNKIFLPSLLLASQTSEPLFEYLNSLSEEDQNFKGKIMLATVEGDVHDIGKKIVGTVLKSSGFEISDIGKDKTKEEIIEKVKEFKPDILGLSAMMTTTVGRVEEVSELISKEKLNVLLISGGASMTKNLAEKFGCNGYSRNASSVTSLCENLLKKEKL